MNQLNRTDDKSRAGNPVFKGFYADPEARILNGNFWIFPTCSAPYEEQTFFDAFYSKDLVTWNKVEKVLDSKNIIWAKKALWAPSPIEYHGKYYFFFAANDIQSDLEVGGIGVAVSENPGGPYKDFLGKPLIGKFINKAQPIDAHVYVDDDTIYLYYGGWGHCNVVKLNNDLMSFGMFPDGEVFKEITPQGYVEAPYMIKRAGKYYFMWAEGNWMGPGYCVAYAISNSPYGPFNRIGKILEQNPLIATGAGHHGVFHIPGTDDWYIVYHRRPFSETSPHSRVICIDQMFFDKDGFIKPVEITDNGVKAVRISNNG
jgi:beta-xylosidase